MNTLSGAPIGWLLVFALVGISLAALLSAGEAAVVRVTRTAVGEIVDTRSEIADRIQRLVVSPGHTAASAAFVRVFAEMLATACITVCVAALVDPWWLVLLISVVVGALVALVLVRISPRTIGRRRPAQTLVFLSSLLDVVLRITGPITQYTGASRSPTDAMDEHELRDMVDRVSDARAIEDDERTMLRSVFELRTTLTREVMVPRTDMVTSMAATPLPKALALFLRSGFSRVPVVGESVDELLGVAYFKDVVRVLNHSQDAETRTLGEVMRSPLFVPESKAVDDLLREMQSASSHIALVVDEYGGIAGLVTIEDALEEIVGELTDEHDSVAPEIEEIEPGTFRVPARLALDELGELFDLDVNDDEVDTAGGLLAKALGKVPLTGSTADANGLHLVAERVEGRRKQLSSILVCRSDPAERPTNHGRRAFDENRTSDDRRTPTDQQEMER
ncbi:hemolysin family protein [Sanguibacter antarcticus]|uniref:CBS domain containing-hemolysin-like protein n=1 Tax=Sanguibacter antarcticus TaxID=372484 RepID=A0A2A9E1R8_9MICO|nr:hemolysin family protein [Sanguibacter antarcticus]PFG32794.1 CBS domain containing-hemolysin-like protein [Sanguibacter antarcticus]